MPNKNHQSNHRHFYSLWWAFQSVSTSLLTCRATLFQRCCLLSAQPPPARRWRWCQPWPRGWWTSWWALAASQTWRRCLCRSLLCRRRLLTLWRETETVASLSAEWCRGGCHSFSRQAALSRKIWAFQFRIRSQLVKITRMTSGHYNWLLQILAWARALANRPLTAHCPADFWSVCQSASPHLLTAENHIARGDQRSHTVLCGKRDKNALQFYAPCCKDEKGEEHDFFAAAN